MTSQSNDITLLTNIDDISASWVADALRRAGMDAGNITDVHFEPIGQGNSNETYKLNLDYPSNTDEGPRSLILKIHSADPETAQRTGTAGLYRCEHGMVDVLPLIPDLNVPEYYHSAISSDGCQSNILMQDLSGLCTPGDQITGITPDQAMTVLHEIIKVHKHFWKAPELTKFNWTIDSMRLHHEGAALLKNRLADRLSEDEMVIINNSLPYIDKWLDETPANYTLLHSDCRADNVMFDQTETNNLKAYIIDWATSTIGDPMADVAYLISSSVNTKDRAACEEAALSFYADELSTVYPGYTLDMARNAYRQNITSSMHLTLLAGFTPQTPHTDNLLETLARRNCATLKNWLFS